MNAEHILKTTARLFGVAPEDITTSSRRRRLTEPRQALAYALQQDGWAQTRIGAVLGGRDHTTVCHHARNAAVRMAADPQFAERVRALMAELRISPVHQFQPCACAEQLTVIEARLARLEAKQHER